MGVRVRAAVAHQALAVARVGGADVVGPDRQNVRLPFGFWLVSAVSADVEGRPPREARRDIRDGAGLHDGPIMPRPDRSARCQGRAGAGGVVLGAFGPPGPCIPGIMPCMPGIIGGIPPCIPGPYIPGPPGPHIPGP